MLRCALLIGLLISVLAPASAPAQHAAVLSSGQTVSGAISAAADDVLFRSADGRAIPLGSLQEIRPAHDPWIPMTAGPILRIGLPGTDVLSGDLSAFRQTQVRFQTRDWTPIEIVREAITLVEQLPGQRLVLFEPFDGLVDNKGTSPHSLPAAFNVSRNLSREFPFAAPMHDGFVQVWFQGDAATARDTTLELLGTRNGSRRLSLPLLPEVQGSPLELDGGWHCLSVWLRHGATRVAVDQQVVAEAGALKALGGVRVVRGGVDGQLVVDDVLAVRFEEGPDVALPLRLSDQDAVQQWSGDELFGELTGYSAAGVQMKTPFGARTLPRTDVRRVLPRLFATSGHGVKGVVSEIELSSIFGGERSPADQLTGAITGITGETLQFDHPWLGTLKIPLRDVARIRPQFRGQWWPVEMRPHHLGDEVRSDFEIPRPEGPVLKTQWTMPSGLDGDLAVSLQVADLEPCGPQTAAESPTLSELRAGGLVTELRVNGKLAAVLNQLMNVRPSLQHPETLRIPVSRKLWKEGLNVIELVQRPLRAEATSFDDVLVSQLSVLAIAVQK